MKSKLFISLSTIALVGISLVSHAAYVKYMENDINHVPKGDCLEMMCEHGCVEEEGTFVGHCCPNDGSNNAACTYNECCQSGVCNSGKCGPAPCQFNGQTYQDREAVGECGICNDGTINTSTTATAPDCKGPCNTTTWTWDLITDYTNKDGDGKCCINGARSYDENNCPDPATIGQCTFNGTTYSNGDTVGECGVCNDGTISANTTATAPDCNTCDTTTWNWLGITDASNQDLDHRCCVDGVRKNDMSLCPAACETEADCGVCQTCCDSRRQGIPYTHCFYGGIKTGERHGNQACLNAVYRRNVEGVGYKSFDRGGLYDCWEWTGSRNYRKQFKNKHTGEEIDLTSAQIKTFVTLGGEDCLLDPRDYWSVLPEDQK